MFKQNPWLVLDGELYNHDLRDDFEKIISLVRKQKPTDDDRKEARKSSYSIMCTTTRFVIQMKTK